MEVEDEKVFGKTLVYCSQHLNVHSTGWCTVSVDEKVGLGEPQTGEGIKRGYAKARRLGLTIYGD